MFPPCLGAVGVSFALLDWTQWRIIYFSLQWSLGFADRSFKAIPICVPFSVNFAGSVATMSPGNYLCIPIQYPFTIPKTLWTHLNTCFWLQKRGFREFETLRLCYGKAPFFIGKSWYTSPFLKRSWWLKFPSQAGGEALSAELETHRTSAGARCFLWCVWDNYGTSPLKNDREPWVNHLLSWAIYTMGFCLACWKVWDKNELPSGYSTVCHGKIHHF